MFRGRLSLNFIETFCGTPVQVVQYAKIALSFAQIYTSLRSRSCVGQIWHQLLCWHEKLYLSPCRLSYIEIVRGWTHEELESCPWQHMRNTMLTFSKPGYIILAMLRSDRLRIIYSIPLRT